MKEKGSMVDRISKAFSRKDSLESNLKKYMEFYYPSTNQATYTIRFPWGNYTITTENPLSSEVHEDSKPYLGFITFRPTITTPSNHIKPSLFLITSEGEVWENHTGQKIPNEKERKEIIEKKHESGITTTTRSICSVSEPVIDHFRTNKEQWTKYGILEVIKGKTRLKAIKE